MLDVWYYFPLFQIRVWTRSYEKAKSFAKKFDVAACETAKEAVTGADVIVTCTASETPVLEASWLEPMAHVNCKCTSIA